MAAAFQADAFTSAFEGGGVAPGGTAATSQGQGASGAASFGITGSLSAGQGQTNQAGASLQVNLSSASGQGQTASGATMLVLPATGASGQGQTASAVGGAAAPAGTAATFQSQRADAVSALAIQGAITGRQGQGHTGVAAMVLPGSASSDQGQASAAAATFTLTGAVTSGQGQSVSGASGVIVGIGSSSQGQGAVAACTLGPAIEPSPTTYYGNGGASRRDVDVSADEVLAKWELLEARLRKSTQPAPSEVRPTQGADSAPAKPAGAVAQEPKPTPQATASLARVPAVELAQTMPANSGVSADVADLMAQGLDEQNARALLAILELA